MASELGDVNRIHRCCSVIQWLLKVHEPARGATEIWTSPLALSWFQRHADLIKRFSVWCCSTAFSCIYPKLDPKFAHSNSHPVSLQPSLPSSFSPSFPPSLSSSPLRCLKLKYWQSGCFSTNSTIKSSGFLEASHPLDKDSSSQLGHQSPGTLELQMVLRVI